MTNWLQLISSSKPCDITVKLDEKSFHDISNKDSKIILPESWKTVVIINKTEEDGLVDCYGKTTFSPGPSPSIGKPWPRKWVCWQFCVIRQQKISSTRINLILTNLANFSVNFFLLFSERCIINYYAIALILK